MEIFITIAIILTNFAALILAVKYKLLAQSYREQWHELDARNTEAQASLQSALDSHAFTPTIEGQLSRVIGILQGEDDV